jgi:hypothetical protein
MTSHEDRPASLSRVVRLGVSLAFGAAAIVGPWSVARGLAQQPAPAAASQEVAKDDVPAHLAVVDGAVTLERDGQARTADINTVLLEGDRLRTDRGRAEILFGDGSALDLDEFTGVDLLSASLVRLRGGQLRIAITRLSNDVNYRIDAAGSSVEIHSAVDCRVMLTDQHSALEVILWVFRGTAELSNTHGRSVVRAGAQASAVDDTAPSTASAFNVSGDEFDQWVDDQHQARVGSTSAQYLPEEVRPYSGVLDSNGSWENDPSYGEVWYPQVNSGWWPYSDGYYSYIPVYGWCWVGATPWAWPTQHYGHWGQASGRWYWKPDRRWSPAGGVDGMRPSVPVATPRLARSTSMPLRSPTNMRVAVAVSEVDPASAASRPVSRGAALGSPTRTATSPGAPLQARPLASPSRAAIGAGSWSPMRPSANPTAPTRMPSRTLESTGRPPQPVGLPARSLEGRPQAAQPTVPSRAVGAPARAGGAGADPPAHGPSVTYGRTAVPPSSGGRGRM